MIRHIVLACALLVPHNRVRARTAGAPGAPVVFFSIFGPDGEQLQRFYTDLFEWKNAPNADVMTAVTSPSRQRSGRAWPRRSSTSASMTSRRHWRKSKSEAARFNLRLEVQGRVVLAVFNNPAGNSVGLVEMENGKAKVPK